MIHSSDIEEEVDTIRDRLYSTIKDMKSGERVEYINARAREIMKKQVSGVNAGILPTKGDQGTPEFPRPDPSHS